MVNARSWAFYGRAGTGKTTLAGSFPKPMLYVDIKDEGTDSIADIDGIYVYKLTEWAQRDEIYWHLYENPGEYKSVVFDTVTQLQGILVEEIAGDKARKKGKNSGDWGVMTKQEWGEVAAKMKAAITYFRDLDIEAVFLAQDRFISADDDDLPEQPGLDPETGPRLSPSVRDHLCAEVSVIGHTFIRQRTITKKINGKKKERRKTEYCVRLGPSAYYITKIRKPRDQEIPEVLADPTYDELVEIIRGA